MASVQAVTLIEASVLLLVNGAGALLTLLAWRVSLVDVREAQAWVPPPGDPDDTERRRHNRLLVTEDARHAEVRRFEAHLLIACVGFFWLLTPQPTNPAVIWWAVAIRCSVIGVSLLLIDKTLHHLIARWRFDRPDIVAARPAHVWPALRLAWRDVQSLRVESKS